MSTTPAAEKPKFAFHIARDDGERQRIFRFRYQCLTQEMGADSVHADHNKKTLSDDLDARAIQLYMTEGGQVIAAVRINVVEDGIPQPLSDHLKFEAFKDFPASSLTLTSRLMVAADWRASGATQVLLGAAYKIAQKRGSRFDFCACGPALVEIFELLGYRRYTSNFVDEDDGYQIPLVMVMEDAAYLLAIRSPFARLAIESKSGDNAVAWFTKHFGDHVAPVLTRRMNEEQFWEFLTERMHQTPLVGIPLLEGIRFADAKRLVKAGTVLRCKAGDRIVRAGEVGREMFVVLSGAVEVQGDAGNALTTLGAGALFGEIGLFSQSPRTANVVAKQDVEVLVLTQDFITRSMKSMPEVAAALLFNLSRILSARLRDSTRQWIDAVGGTAAASDAPEPEGEAAAAGAGEAGA